MNEAQPVRVLLDINVILDVLTRREHFYQDSAEVWMLSEHDKIEGMLAAHSITTLHYLYTRQTSRQAAIMAIKKLLQVFRVAGIDQPVLETALHYEWTDFEDAVQMAAASASGCDYLITRNTQDFKDGPVQAILPADFMAIFRAKYQESEPD